MISNKKYSIFLTCVAILFLFNSLGQITPAEYSDILVDEKDSISQTLQTKNGAFFFKSGLFTAQKKVDNFEPTALLFGAGVEAYFKKWVFGTEMDFTYRDHPDREKFFSKIKTPMLKIFANYLLFDRGNHRLFSGIGLGYLSSISPDFSNDYTTPDMERFQHQDYIVVSGRFNYRFNIYKEMKNKLRFYPEVFIEAFLPLYGRDNFYSDRHPKIPNEFRAIGPGVLFGIKLSLAK